MPYTKEKSLLKVHELYQNLKATLTRFLSRFVSSEHNIPYLVFSFAMAIFLWQSIAGGEKIEEQYDIRLAINYRNLPEGLTIKERTDTVFIRVRGLAEDFKELDRRELVYSIDLSDIDRGANMLAINEENLAGLNKFEIISTNPSHLLIVAENFSEKQVELEAIPSKRQLANGYHVRDIKISPNYVRVRGGESIISTFNTLNVPINIGVEDKAGLYTQSVAVQAKNNVEVYPPIVEVSYRLEPRMEEVSIERDVKSFTYSTHGIKTTSKKAIVKFYCPISSIGDKALYNKIEVYQEPYTIAANNTRLRAVLPIEFRLISIEEK